MGWWEFKAAPGERNDITVERLPTGQVRFTDLAAPPVGCTPEGPNTVLCSAADIGVQIDTGDGDDVVVVRTAFSASVVGGEGNDRLVALASAYLDGGAGDDRLEGSPEDDDLDGGPGRDQVLGGAGGDDLTDDDHETDLLDGGDGADDRLRFGGRRGVRVDLARDVGPDGDRLPGIEHVNGTDGPDVLLGDGAANQLDGGAGNDRLVGRDGADLLDGDRGDDTAVGGPGDDALATTDDDRLDAGPGDDYLQLSISGSAYARCGAGEDKVDVDLERGLPRVRRDCETLVGPGPSLRITPSRLILRWRSGEYGRPCRIRATVDRSTTVLRRFTGASLRARGDASVRLVPTRRCRGAFGNGYTATAFRLLP
ncbi:hypothetical protein OJ997_25985 [Solirubrobacter phytolaccae]|uniref:Calcium-binding protein n=1 Tax=Solirubrobacter phytolaccae TaxID=1404360 RepID=A0A9X3S9V0_9ACTN|nr:calcium-binding protein [Solirubrobacter phytolaccae]MDA0183784.1 hypothetical protein [Solirubrobacter phytolaccae]